MFFGRFAMIGPALAIAGSMVAEDRRARSRHFSTNGALFTRSSSA